MSSRFVQMSRRSDRKLVVEWMSKLAMRLRYGVQTSTSLKRVQSVKKKLNIIPEKTFREQAHEAGDGF